MTTYLFRVILNSKFICSLPISLNKYSTQAILKTNIHNAGEEVSKLSTLFVPGRHGGDVYQIVKPFIDIEYIAHNLGNIKLSCDQRGIELNLGNILKIARQWANMKNEYSPLVEKDREYIEEIAHLQSSNLEKEVETMNEERKKLIDKIIVERNKIHDIEDILMPLLQKIPHVLHPNTPLQFSIMDICKEPLNMDVDIKSHTEIAKNMLEFSNNSPISYFLSGKLSLLDFAIQTYFADRMCALDFTPLSSVDFCKSFVIEAVGRDPQSSQDSIQIQEKKNSSVGQKLHVVGGASLESLCAYLTNMNIAEPALPLKYFSLGRHYNASHGNSKFPDLFSVVQSTNVHSMLLSKSSCADDFDTMLQAILSCYSELDLPFRTVRVAAKGLLITESRRTQLELWSPARKDYIPAAYLSEHDDFISKRLHITYGENHQKAGYCNIVEGVVCNVPVIIGCVIENFQTKDCDFNIPDVLKCHLPS